MTHEAEFRIHYEDTDMAGVVYYANYLKFIERARSDALREAGVDQRAMRESGLVFVVTRVEADYLSPARYDDVIRVETTLKELRGASATLRQAVFREKTPLFRSVVRFACMGLEGRPLRMPAAARAALEAL
ncbi:tol-pal system-associated acyl-CoA thioesterase [Pikeienuella piscinae]|uniref:Tol-pal system-associated acyl-CoA thioesterase n=1 Tax=Pikeienuella piscinae TaxID=2748098 RepID=A0A7L5BXQ4_9RHOB|nr:tol-pal system-associated acyl-CoA thioesterase [Pikeienuella piscinae]QIE55307.1 tol-pal system-associated acyl-CoA thioesterase [Pikeienuella piscinae]